MKDMGSQLARAQKTTERVTQVYTKRVKLASEKYQQKLAAIVAPLQADGLPKTPADAWRELGEYSVDAAQRAVLFWDTLRRRGNQWLAHEQAGKPPLLHFEYEMVLDARTFERPVNYALVKIVPPAGVKVDDRKRPFIIIDPRAGHGPGIGGFKDDSQVGVALRAGHPVYFVIFFPEPMPGQRMIDVTAAEKRFVHKVRELHPASEKPALVGNCQGGWAAMMLAAADPEDTGPIVINGAPMSYWGGAWSGGEGDNPMRYSGGMLGGTWLSSFASDLGNGVFDGAALVQNFENLNPANTFVDKYYNLFNKADTEPPRFLEFEKWWGGYFLMNKEEIEWITRNLFVGNALWKGGVKSASGEVFDLRKLKQPIVLFASMGDNITPPQQAFNWVADVYGSTEEIKSRGQVIVGLLHQDIGHLGIFVSGKVAKREHRNIVEVLASIEALPPGLYAMQIRETADAKGEPHYEVQFEERRLEDVVKRLNRFERADEKPFEAVAALSEFNQRAYELFLQPFVQATATEAAAEASRRFHPLRLERWAISDLNPFLWWLGPAAESVKAQRQAVSPKQSLRKAEVAAAAMASAALDLYRDLRDAATEAAFFQTYGTLFGLYLADSAAEHAVPTGANGEAYVQQALAAIEQGGFMAAVARTASLLAQRGVAIDLEGIALKKELIADYRELLPPIDFETARQVRGMQDLIVAQAPELAIETLPRLLAVPADRDRFARFFERVLSDSRVSTEMFTGEQKAMFERIWTRLDLPLPGRARLARAVRGNGKAVPARAAPAREAVRKSTGKSGARRGARV
jgi:pimeloyl-ACP methyl ester carboxylesterase